MRTVLTAGQMAECDRMAIGKLGIPSLVLMERAALACAEEAEDLYRECGSNAPILCVCGNGNNGADGIACARILTMRGIRADLFFPNGTKKGTPEWKTQLSIAEKAGVRTRRSLRCRDASVIVDALFGNGLSKPLEGACASAVNAMNRSERPILAIDLPSGIDASSGAETGISVRADRTVALQFEKIGHILLPGALCCGRVVVRDIGIPLKRGVNYAKIPENTDLDLLPLRKRGGHKGTYGKVLVIAGSRNMAGAAYLTALAAFQSGVGMVRILTPECNRVILQKKLPEAMLNTYRDEASALSELTKALSWADAVAAGPGISESGTAKAMIEALLTRSDLPLVLDADGLNVLYGDTSLIKAYRGEAVLTPHLMEMNRLCGLSVSEIRKDRIGCAVRFAKRNRIALVLKDARSVIALKTGEVFLNTSGNSGMATAGSGDVLTGILAGLLAKGIPAEHAAPFGCLIHGLAGDQAAAKKGKNGMLAGDLANEVSGIIGEH